MRFPQFLWPFLLTERDEGSRAPEQHLRATPAALTAATADRRTTRRGSATSWKKSLPRN